MRISVVFLIAALLVGSTQAQSTPPTNERLKKFQQKAGVPKVTPPKVCSIPLVRARPAAPVDPKMAIAPKGGVLFQLREVVPPAPVCDANVRWK
jgi:hypothetical protein